MTVYINGTTGYSGPVGTIGDLTTTGNTTLGDASGDTLTLNGNTASVPNGLNFTNGNIGVGVTPSAWTTFKAIELGQAGNSIGGYVGGNSTVITSNAYYSTSGTAGFKYGVSGSPAMQYAQEGDGTHKWFIAGAGTANANISFTQAMTLDASGRFLLGTTTAADFTATIYNTSSTSAGIQCQNSSTGTGSNNGFYVGISGSGTAGTVGYVWNCENDRISFGTNNTEVARIDSSGRLLIGQTSGSYKLSVTGNVAATAAFIAPQSFSSNQNFPPSITPLTTVGSVVVPTNNTWTTVFTLTNFGATSGANYASDTDSATGIINIYRDFNNSYVIAQFAFSTKNIFGFDNITLLSSYAYNSGVQVTGGNNIQVRQAGNNASTVNIQILSFR